MYWEIVSLLHYDPDKTGSFIDKIKSELDSCTPFKSYVKHTPAHFSAGCNHKESWELRTQAHPYFNKIYHKFYDDYRHRRITKYVPKKKQKTNRCDNFNLNINLFNIG